MKLKLQPLLESELLEFLRIFESRYVHERIQADGLTQAEAARFVAS